LTSQTSSISWQTPASCVQECPFSSRTLSVLPLSGTEKLFIRKIILVIQSQPCNVSYKMDYDIVFEMSCNVHPFMT